MYDHLLLPTDGSAGMERVIDHAGELAAVHEATLHALYVVDTTGVAPIALEDALEGVEELMREEGETALDRVESVVGDDVAVERTILQGRPETEILDHADAVGCDAIVMGTHGRGGIDRILLGSVAERVVRRARVPVVTVRVTPESV